MRLLARPPRLDPFYRRPAHADRRKRFLRRPSRRTLPRHALRPSMSADPWRMLRACRQGASGRLGEGGMDIEKLTGRARGFVQSAQSLALREGTSNSPPTEVELVPRRPALDVDIAAEPQRIDRRSRGGLKRDDRGEIDDRNDLAGDIGEAVARRVQELRQSA